MWREAVGICVVRGSVVAVLLRQVQRGASPELAGWCVVPEQGWRRGVERQLNKRGIRAGTRLGVSVPTREIFVHGGRRSCNWGHAECEAVKEWCREELQTVEPLCVDVAVFRDASELHERKVAVAARRASVERCRVQACLAGFSLAVITPEIAALFALLIEAEPSVTQACVALLHLEDDRIIAGVFDRGAILSQCEYSCASRLAGAEAALRSIQAEHPSLSLAYISGSQLADRLPTARQSGSVRLARWNPFDVVETEESVGDAVGASLLVPTALAFCALEPDAPTRLNLVRGEYAKAEAVRKRGRRQRLGVRIAMAASLALSTLLVFDGSSKRSARAALLEVEAAIVKERIGRSSVEQAILAEQALLQESQAEGLLPLGAGGTLRSLISALPTGLAVSALYIDNSTVRISGSSSVPSRVSDVAEAVLELLPGATVEVSEDGGFTVHGERGVGRGSK